MSTPPSVEEKLTVSTIDLETFDPATDLDSLDPPQGAWSEEEYLRLTDGSNRIVEYTDGYLEFLAVPTPAHQRIVGFFYILLKQFVDARELGRSLARRDSRPNARSQVPRAGRRLSLRRQ